MIVSFDSNRSFTQSVEVTERRDMFEGLSIDRFHEIKKDRCNLDFNSKPETRFHKGTLTKGDPAPLDFEVI